MGESLYNATEGSGKKFHTWQRTVGANSVEDGFYLPGEYPIASYSIVVGNIALATAASHPLQIMAGAALNVRLRSIEFMLLTPPAALTIGEIQLWRLSTAGTGGTVITPRPTDTSFAAAGCTAMTLPTAKGTELLQLRERSLWYGTTAIPTGELCRWRWQQHRSMAPFIALAGTTNGFAIKNVSGLATATVAMEIELVETSFL